MDRAKMFFILAGLSGLLGVGGVYMLNGERAGLIKKRDDLKKQILDEDKLKKQLIDKQVLVNESQEELNHLEKGVPASEYIPTLLAELDRLGREKGLLITGVRPRPAEKKKEPTTEDKEGKKKTKKKPEAYEELVIEVKGSGSYTAIHDFIASLTQFPKILGAIACDIQPKNRLVNAEDEGGPMKVEMSLDLKAYLFKDRKEKPEKEIARTEFEKVGNHEQG